MGQILLGGFWLSMHVPAGGRELVIRALDLGFDGLVPCPTESPVPWEEIGPLLSDLPAEIPAVRVHQPVPAENDPALKLASGNQADRRRALDQILAWAQRGADLQAATDHQL